MIEIKDFSFRYRDNEETALDHINLTIEKGEFLGIIGNSGAGKSTLTYALSGIVPHHFQGDFFGEIKVNGLDTVEVSTERLAEYVGEVFQDIDSQMVSSVVEDEILFGLENFGFSHDEIGKRLENALAMLGIEDLRQREISSLSGGQKQKVAIAAILALDREIIVLDEPTGELDPESTIMIFEILKRLNREFGKTIVIVEQKISMLTAYADRIVVLEKGKIVYEGTNRDVTNQLALFEELGINVPTIVRLGTILKQRGVYAGEIPATMDEAEAMAREVLGC